METPKEDEQLVKSHGRWRNAVAIFDRQTKKFNVSLFPFKMLIIILKTCPFAVPLGFMYKHHHGFFLPVGAAAATLMTFKPMFSNLLKGIDPVDREKGHFLGTVSAAVVAMAYIQLHQWKWQPGIQGLFARLLCACMDEANAHRNFAASITGGVWLLGQLAGFAPWEPLQCMKGLAEKCHGDYLCVLGQLAAELLPLYDTRLCGLLQEMKCRYCGDDGKIENPYIKLVPSDHKTYPNLIKRLMGHGGGLTLAVTQMLFWCDDLVEAIKTYVYFTEGEPLKIIDAKPKKHSYPDHKYVLVRSTARQSTLDGSGGPPETTDEIYSRCRDGRWILQRRAVKMPKLQLNVNKLKACADNSELKWCSSFTGTSDEVNAQTPQQYKDLYAAVRVGATSLISMKDACEKVNGEDRILHCKEHVIVAELLEACSDVVSECKEEILKQLDDGRHFTVLTAACTYDGGAKVQVYIDGARGKEELMKGQIACVVISIVFPEDIDEVIYQRGSGRKHSVAPPRGRRLYCVLDGHLSAASREALISIDIPKCFLFWGLCRLHGIPLAAGWLEANPPRGHWTGNDELKGAFRDGICGPADVRRKALEIGARNADKLELASPCAFKVGDFCDVLASGDGVDEALLARVRGCVSGLGASLDDEGDAKMDDAPAPSDDAEDLMDYAAPAPADALARPADLGVDSEAGAGDDVPPFATLVFKDDPWDEEDDEDGYDSGRDEELATAPPQPSALERTIAGDDGAAREHLAHHSQATRPAPPPNLGAAAPVVAAPVAGRPIPPARAFADLTPVFRALPNAPRKPHGPRDYRPQNDADAPIQRLTFSDSEDSDTW